MNSLYPTSHQLAKHGAAVPPKSAQPIRRSVPEGAVTKWVRQSHRWVAIAFTLAVTANFVDMAVRPGQPPGLVTYAPLLPLLVLLVTGLYLFLRPHLISRRSGGNAGSKLLGKRRLRA